MPLAPETPSLWSQARAAVTTLFTHARTLPLWSLAPGEPIVPSEITAVQLLRAAKGLIELEDKWVQGRYETVRGRRCAMGALQAAARVLRDPRAFEEAKDLLRTEAVLRGYSHVEKMNDRSSHSQVLAVFDAAIAKAEARVTF
ncbi:MAG TPA: hypothetical protein VFW75_10490 [Acetobacteraceae bacterium]|nr:hypothetical protein [Acetobacteraceae bacterium]